MKTTKKQQQTAVKSSIFQRCSPIQETNKKQELHSEVCKHGLLINMFSSTDIAHNPLQRKAHTYIHT